MTLSCFLAIPFVYFMCPEASRTIPLSELRGQLTNHRQLERLWKKLTFSSLEMKPNKPNHLIRSLRGAWSSGPVGQRRLAILQSTLRRTALESGLCKSKLRLQYFSDYSYLEIITSSIPIFTSPLGSYVMRTCDVYKSASQVEYRLRP